MRTLFRWLLRFGTGLCGLLLIAIGWVHSPWWTTRLVRYGLHRVHAAYGVGIAYRQIRIHPGWTAVVLDEVRVYRPGAPPFFSAQRIRVDLHWWRLHRPIRRITLVRPQVHIRRDARGRWNFPSRTAAQPAGQARDRLPTSLPDIVIIAGRGQFQDVSTARRWVLRRLRVRGMLRTDVYVFDLRGELHIHPIGERWRFRLRAQFGRILVARAVGTPVSSRFATGAVTLRARYHPATRRVRARITGRVQWTDRRPVPRWVHDAGVDTVAFHRPVRWEIHLWGRWPQVLRIRLRGVQANRVRVHIRCTLSDGAWMRCGGEVRVPTRLHRPASVRFHGRARFRRQPVRWRGTLRWVHTIPPHSAWPNEWRRAVRISGWLQLAGRGTAWHALRGTAQWTVRWANRRSVWTHRVSVQLRGTAVAIRGSFRRNTRTLLRIRGHGVWTRSVWTLHAEGRAIPPGVFAELRPWIHLPTAAWVRHTITRLDIRVVRKAAKQPWRVEWTVVSWHAHPPRFPGVRIEQYGRARLTPQRWSAAMRVMLALEALPEEARVRCQAHGRWTPRKGRWDCTLRVRNAEWSSLEQRITIRHLTARLYGTLRTVQGGVIRLDGRWAVRMPEMSRETPGTPWVFADVQTHWIGRSATDWTGSVVISGANWRVNADGRIDFPHRLSVRISGRGMRVSAGGPLPIRMRRWVGSFRISGSYTRPRLHGQWHIVGLKFGDLSLGDLRVRCTTPAVRQYTCMTDLGALAGTLIGRLRLNPRGAPVWTLRASITPTDLSWRAYTVTAQAQMDARGTGFPWQSDADWQIRVRLDRWILRSRTETWVRLVRPVRITVRSGDLTLNAPLAWTGAFGNGQLTVEHRTVHLEHRIRLAELARRWSLRPLDGNVRIALDLPLDRPPSEGRWTLFLHHLQLPLGYRLAACTLHGPLRIAPPTGGPCVFERTGPRGAAERIRVVADGTSVRVDLDRIRPGDWWVALGRAAAEDVLPGRLTASVTVRTHPEPAVRVRIADLEFTWLGLALEIRTPLELVWSPEQLIVDLTPLRIHGMPLHARLELRPTDTASVYAAWLRPNAWQQWNVELRWQGALDLAMVQPWVAWPIAGRIEGMLQVSGPLRYPLVFGEFELRDGTIYLPEYGLRMAPISGHVRIQGIDRVDGEMRAAGVFGAWRLRFRGGLYWSQRRWDWPLAEWMVERLRIVGPEGWTVTVSGTIHLDTTQRPWTIRGSIRIPQGVVATPIDLETLLRREAPPEWPVWVRDIRYAVQVQLDRIDVTNNLVALAGTGRWQLVGTVANPRLDGEWWAFPGGTVTFQQRTYTVERLRLTWRDAPYWQPEVDLLLSTVFAAEQSPWDRVRVRVTITGTPQQPRIVMDADPPLSEGELIALIMTGTPALPESTRTDGAPSARVVGQALLYSLGGGIASRVLAPIRRWIGIQDVAVAPVLVGQDVDPIARITIQRPWTRWVRTTIALDVRNTVRQTWVVRVDPLRWMQVRITRSDTAEWALGVFPQWTHPRPAQVDTPPPHAPVMTLRAVHIAGDAPWSPAILRKLARVHVGQPIRFDRLQRNIRRVETLLHRMGYWSAIVLWYLQPDAQQAGAYHLFLEVRKGPRFHIEWIHVPAGWTPPDPVTWWVPCWYGHTLVGWGRLCMHRQATVWARFQGWQRSPLRIAMPRVTETDVTVPIVWQGPDTTRVPEVTWDWQFVEAQSLSERVRTRIARPAMWIEACETAGRETVPAPFWWYLMVRPEICTRAWHRWARREGWQIVDITIALPEGAAQGRVTITLRPRVIRRVRVRGLPDASRDLARSLRALEGRLYRPEGVTARVRGLCRALQDRGYPDARCTFDWNEPHGDLTVRVRPGPEARIGTIVWDPPVRRPAWLARYAGLRPGRVLRRQDLERARHRLWTLGFFRNVRISIDATTPPDRRRIRIETVRRSWLRLNGGIRYVFRTESEFRPWEFELFGQWMDPWDLGLQLFVGIPYTSRLRRQRVGLAWSYLFGWPVYTQVFYFHEREDDGTFISEERSWFFEQVMRLGDHWQVRYRYSPKTVHVFEKNPPPDSLFVFDILIRIRRLALGVQWDTRDFALDPRHGHLMVIDVEYAPGWAGSEIEYIKVFTQWSGYWTSPNRRWSALGGIRFGWGRPLGASRVLLSSERFFAGGPASFRGLPTDELGPRNRFTGAPDGGEVLFLLNGEWIWNLSRDFGLAVFLDVGNVFARRSEFSLSLRSLREAAGIGLRYHSPLGLIRLDWSVLLDPQPGERHTRWSLAIGPIL